MEEDYEIYLGNLSHFPESFLEDSFMSGQALSLLEYHFEFLPRDSVSLTVKYG